MRTQEEYMEGTLTSIRDNFRVFDSMEEGVKGYFEFIQLKRYRNLQGIRDPQEYLETIRADGYATSFSYVEDCMKVIRQYELTRFDEGGCETMAKTAESVLDVMRGWLGFSEANGKFKEIIDLYNGVKPLPRGYAVQYSDEWCDTCVSAAGIKAGCGLPQLEEENAEEYLSLPVALFGSGSFYLLRAKGTSMIEAGINPGDLVLIREQSEAKDGEIIVALVNNENTLKRLRVDEANHCVRLHPENKKMQDIIVPEGESLQIQGVAVHVIKALV